MVFLREDHKKKGVFTRLALKYRPNIFDDVIGQDVTIRILKASIVKKVYSPAFLFSGPAGTGKTTIGRILAKAMLCDNPVNGNPCGSCESCKLFEQEQHFGYKEMDAASVGNKDEMIKLRDEASYHSVNKKKILLLDESQDVSKAGQDALLKQVEQCPQHLVYVFCTTNPEKMNETLRDRCMQFQISRVKSDFIFNRLKYICEKEDLKYDNHALKYISKKSNGHVRNAINMLEEVSYIGEVNIENLNLVSQNYDEDIFNILFNLGKDLKASLSACRKISSLISVQELYTSVISMLNDASKLLYGFEDFLPERLSYLIRLKDLHGYSLVEFLDYLMKRDKYIDKIGLQSDIILLHYKFCANSFNSSPQTQPISEQKETIFKKEYPQPSNEKAFSHAELSKMDVRDRSRVLRHQKMTPKSKGIEQKEWVPDKWPLPKEQRLGESSFDEKELSPQDFSRYLVGGRGREKQ